MKIYGFEVVLVQNYLSDGFSSGERTLELCLSDDRLKVHTRSLGGVNVTDKETLVTPDVAGNGLNNQIRSYRGTIYWVFLFEKFQREN